LLDEIGGPEVTRRAARHAIIGVLAEADPELTVRPLFARLLADSGSTRTSVTWHAASSSCSAADAAGTPSPKSFSGRGTRPQRADAPDDSWTRSPRT
jgi:hypothetical protein